VFVVSVLLLNGRMKTIDEIRRIRLHELVAEYGGLSALATHLGKSESQVGQWLHGLKDSKTGKPRGMRSDMARFIEERCGKHKTWLDTLDEPAQPQLELAASQGADRDTNKARLISIWAQLDPEGGAREEILALALRRLKEQRAAGMEAITNTTGTKP
jgi:hypothetical protein